MQSEEKSTPFKERLRILKRNLNEAFSSCGAWFAARADDAGISAKLHELRSLLARRSAASMTIMALALLFAFGGLLRLDVPDSVPAAEKEEVAAPLAPSPYESLALEAEAAYVLDVSTGKVMYEKNAHRQLPLASLTKVMAAVTAADLLPKTAIIRIDGTFLEEEGDSGLFVDENWRLKELLDFALVTSSNDGARAIAAVAGSSRMATGEYGEGRAEFVRRMNQKAVSIGLGSTKFYNETGLDIDEGRSGGYGSARDAAKLFEYALRNHPDMLEATRYGQVNVKSLDNIWHVGYNTNSYVNRIPAVIASKTGYTTLSGGNLVVAFNAGLNRPVVIAVLGSSYQGRFVDVNKLAEATLAEIARSDEGNRGN